MEDIPRLWVLERQGGSCRWKGFMAWDLTAVTASILDIWGSHPSCIANDKLCKASIWEVAENFLSKIVFYRNVL